MGSNRQHMGKQGVVMSRFDKLFEDISQRADSPEIVEFALTEMYKLLLKYTGEKDEKVVVVKPRSNVNVQYRNGAGNPLG